MTKVFLSKPSLLAGLPNAAFLQFVILLQIVLALSACATTAPSYTPSLATSEKLEELALRKMRAGEFSSATPDVERLTIRGGAFGAPDGSSFADYLRKALQKELEMSGLWDESSSTIISGVLQENHLDASGANIGVADLSAEFFVTVGSLEVYRTTHSIHHEWDSSFAGAVAIPRAHDNYVIAVRKLLLQLFDDPKFVRAVGVELK
jgi:hypothetical protein